MEEVLTRVATRWAQEVQAELERIQQYDYQVKAGCSAFLELAIRKMREDASCKLQRLGIKLEALEEIFKERV